MNSRLRPAFPGLAAALVLLVLALGAQYGAAQMWQAFLGPGLGLVVLSGLANLTGLSVVAALGYLASGQPPRLGSAGAQPRFWLALGVTAVGGTVVLGEVANLMAWAWPMPLPLTQLFNSLTKAPVPEALFTLAVVAPVTEEALFRGLLLRGFARRWGHWPALVLSSALFALFHLNLWQAVPAFLAGLYLGSLFLSTGSLVYPVAAHALFNGLPLVLGALGVTVPGYNGALADEVVFQPWPWTLAGFVVLALGLLLTKRWSPPSAEGSPDAVERPAPGVGTK